MISAPARPILAAATAALATHEKNLYATKKITMITTNTLTVAIATLLLVAVNSAASETTTSGKATSASWTQNEPARFYITKPEATAQLNQHKFIGNHSDFFKVLHQDDETLLVGGKNALYNLSIATLEEVPNTRIQWFATDPHRQLCMLKGKHETECQNYIRVYGKTSENQFLLCGTNAYKPQCREYNMQRGANQATDEPLDGENEDSQANGNEADDTSNALVRDYENEEEAQGRCPYNPEHSSSYVFAGKNQMLRGGLGS